MAGHDRRQAEGLYWTARRLKLAGLRAQHPDWPEAWLAHELRGILLLVLLPAGHCLRRGARGD
ncbi:MAG: hypothetical protein KGR98_04050 [Verrucomicrobia bacterium]|nr:hypothetical protein [Verrucomicrobiota bacterium]